MQSRRIKYRHIQCFVAIVRQGSLKAASAQLNLSQPALSKTLKELEGHLGAALLERDRGGVRLTPAGTAFLNHAEMSLAALQRGIDGLSALKSGGGSALRVGGLPSVAARLMPRAVQEFRAMSPETRLTIVDGPHGFLAERLRRGTIDLVVGRLGPPETMQGLSFTQLYLERVVCVCRPGHPLTTDPGPLPLAALAPWTAILPPPGAAIRPMVEALFLSQGEGPLPDRIDSVSGAFGRNYVSTTDAVWFISEGVVAAELAEGRLAALPLDTSVTAGPVGLMTRPEAAPGPAAALFPVALDRAVRALGLAKN